MRFNFLAFSLFLGLFLVSCKGEWTEKEKTKILNDCKLAAAKYGFSNPEGHCDCVLRSIVERYPDPNQFENMEMGEFGQIVAECQGKEVGTRVIWPEKTQKAFVDSCTSMARQMGKASPESYCRCVLDRVIEKYPTNDSISRLDPAVMKEIGISCETKLTP
jgi:hypothetical protein